MNRKLLVLVATLVISLCAHADTFVTFNATGVFQSGSLLTGTATLDSTTGNFVSSTIATTGVNSYDFTNIILVGCDFPLPGDCLLSLTVAGSDFYPDLALTFSLTGNSTGASFVGYNGGLLASTTAPTTDGIGFATTLSFSDNTADQLVSGSFSLPSDGTPTVPEPSTLSLLGTGTLGLLGFARRRRQA